MNKILPIISFCFFVTCIAHAQDFKYSENSYAEINLKVYNKDTSARAVVLNDWGSSQITSDAEDNLEIMHERHVKIKILKTQGFDKGTIEIPLRVGERFEESVEELKGQTVNIDANNNGDVTELDVKKVFTESTTKFRKTIKFTMPNLKPGSIIEYRYTLRSRFWWYYPDWLFQDDIPKINSKYEAHIPGFWTYNISMRGPYKLTNNASDLERECFSYHGAKADCSHLVFQMADVPAFVEEDYMTSPKNFLSAIYFELAEYTNLSTGVKIKNTKEWKDIDYNMKHSDYFGSQLKKKDQLKPYIAPVIAGKTTDLEKAKAVFAYIQKTIKWNNIYSYGSDGSRKALDNHAGDVGDINLTLVTALSAAGINAEAVLLSTRANGLINKLFPVETDFNYVIAKANIGDKSYLLDATDPLLGFDMLPLRCLNDQGRVMSLDKPSYWIDMPTKQRKSQTSTYDLTLQSNGKMKGTITSYYIGYDGYEKRKAIKKFNTQDEYVENLDEKLALVKILNADIANVDSLDLPLTEKFEVEIDAFDNLNHDKLTFNPLFLDRITINPFKLADRNYPVDWGMPSDDRFVLILHLPANYVVESAPQSVGISLPNTGGKFITNFASEGDTFTFSNVFQFTKSVYEAEEYPFLKELYNKVIATQRSEIVFKKK